MGERGRVGKRETAGTVPTPAGTATTPAGTATTLAGKTERKKDRKTERAERF